MKKWLSLCVIVSMILIGSAFAGTPVQVSTVNLADTSFDVVWYTSSVENASLTIGTTTANLSQTFSAAVSSNVHLIHVSGLSASTKYYFSLNSGGAIDSNQGNFYSVQTLPSLSSPGGPIGTVAISGVTKYNSNTPVSTDNVYVFGYVVRASNAQQSLPLLIKMDFVNLWNNQFSYSDFLSSTGGHFYSSNPPANDNVVLYAWTDKSGFGGRISPNTSYSQSVTLNLDSLVLNNPSPNLVVVPPLDVTNVGLITGSNQVTLTWNVSVSTFSVGTLVVRKSGSAPSSHSDGTVVYSGTGNSVLDTGLLQGATYYYGLYAFDQSGDYSSGVVVTTSIPGFYTGGTGSLLDNFDDSTRQSEKINLWGGYNYNYDDSTNNGGNSTSYLGYIAGPSSAGAARISYTFGGSYPYPFAGLGLNVSDNGTLSSPPMDLSQYTGVQFWLEGDGHSLNIEINSSAYVSPNYFTCPISGGTPGSWTKQTISFASFTQPSWGGTVNITQALKNFLAIQFKASSQKIGESGWFAVDDVAFVTTDLTPPVAVSNLAVTLNNEGLSTVNLKLSWLPSISTDSIGVVVVRRTDRYATSALDGTILYNGTHNIYMDTVSKGVSYYYSAFAYDQAGNYSPVADQFYAFNGQGGTQFGLLEVSGNFWISTNASSKLILQNDYVDSVVTITVYVDTIQVSAGATALLIASVGGVNTTTNFHPVAVETAVSVKMTLGWGAQTISFYAIDWNAPPEQSTNKNLSLVVSSSGPALVPGSEVYCYPMPWNPDSAPMSLAYQLVGDVPVTAYIYNINGHLVYKNVWGAGVNGGQTGYNEVSIAQQDAFGRRWSNGMYVIRLLSDKKLLGSSKFLVIR